MGDDDRSWLDRDKKSFSELDRARRDRRGGDEHHPRGEVARKRSEAASKQYLRDIDGIFSGGNKAEVAKLAAAMREAHGTPGLADACRAYHAAAGPPRSAPLVSLFLDAGDRELILLGLAGLRAGRTSDGWKPTGSLRSQLRMLAEDSDGEIAENAEELLELLQA